MNSINEQIRQGLKKRLDAGETQMQIASARGISQGTIYKYLYGSPKPDTDTLLKFARGLNMKFEHLEGIGVNLNKQWGSAQETESHVRQVPIYEQEQVRGSNDINALMFQHGPNFPYLETDMPGDRLFAVRITDDSMSPEFREGEVVIIDPDQATVPNDYVIARDLGDKGKRSPLKQLKQVRGVLFLHPLNPKYEDVPMTKKIKILGKVVRAQRNY